MNPILQTDPRAAYLESKGEIDAAIQAVLEGGRYILGAETAAFEREFAAFLGGGEAVGVANGTDALALALRAVGVGPGDTVVTTAHTAVATVAAVELCGAVPVLADIDPETFTLAPASVEAALAAARERGLAPKAIAVVHLYGHPAALPALLALAAKHGLKLVEDCAQCHGASLDGKTTGLWGDAAAFSFYPTKNLGAIGDGGASASRDPATAQRLRLLREYGWRERYISDIPGLNSRLDELQAALLRVKLRRLESDNARRRALAARYGEGLAGGPWRLPVVRPGVVHAFHQYVLRAAKRDALQAFLKERGVHTLVHYPVPVHLQPAYRDRLALPPGGLPETERAAREVLSLPIYPQLPAAAADRVVEAFLAWQG